jgi:hypothetical protein
VYVILSTEVVSLDVFVIHEPTFFVKANASGHFFLPGIPPGTYSLYLLSSKGCWHALSLTPLLTRNLSHFHPLLIFSLSPSLLTSAVPTLKPHLTHPPTPLSTPSLQAL